LYDAAVWTYGNGADLVRIGFGTFDLVVGAGMTLLGVPTIIGSTAGVGLMSVGIDQILTGITNMRSGRMGGSVYEYIGYSASRGLGFSEETSQIAGGLLPAGLSLGLMWAPSVAVRWTQNGVGRSSILGVFGPLDSDLSVVVRFRGERILNDLADLQPGEKLILLGHGSRTRIQLGTTIYNVDDFINLLRQAKGFPSEIEFLGCNLARGTNSFAERVAAALNIPTSGYATYTYLRVVKQNGQKVLQVCVGIEDRFARILKKIGILHVPARPAMIRPIPATPVHFPIIE